MQLFLMHACVRVSSPLGMFYHLSSGGAEKCCIIRIFPGTYSGKLQVPDASFARFLCCTFRLPVAVVKRGIAMG